MTGDELLFGSLGGDGLPAGVDLPGQAVEGLWEKLETVPLHHEDLELHQRLNVLCEALQAVGGQVEEHLRGAEMLLRGLSCCCSWTYQSLHVVDACKDVSGGV